MGRSIFGSPSGATYDFPDTFAKSPNLATAPTYTPSKTPDIGTIKVGSTSNFDTASNPLRLGSIVPGFIFFVQNDQATNLKVIGPASGDPGVVVPAGASVLLYAASSGFIYLISGSSTTTSVYTLQSAWFVDSINGNDTNDGLTSGTALLTFAEIVRRWGPNPVLKQTTTITIAATGLVATDPIRFQGVQSDRFDHVLIITGTMGAGAALAGGGILTGATSINRAVADCAQKTTIATQVWTGFIRKFVRISGGARNGATAAVTKDLTGGQARNSPFVTIPAGSGPFTLTQVSPAIGDVLVNVSPSVCLAPMNVIGNSIEIRFENLEFRDDVAFSGQILQDNIQVTFNFCIMHGYITQATTGLAVAYQACIFMQDAFLDSRQSSCVILDCAFVGTGDTAMATFYGGAIDGDSIFQGCWITFSVASGNISSISACSFYDETNAARAAINVSQGILNSQNFFTGSAAIGGTGIAGYVAKTEFGGWLLYSATANFVADGGVSRFRYSGANKVIGDLPLVINGNNNAIVPLL